MISIAGGALLLGLAFGLLFRGWSSTEYTVSRERLRIATVTEGPFIRDVSAQGTVVAAVSPTLFAIAPGNISYLVRAGDTVKAGQVLATLVSPTLENEYQRERATLDSLNAALSARRSKSAARFCSHAASGDLAKVQIHAAEREKQRAQAAWDEGVISERDSPGAEDDARNRETHLRTRERDRRPRARSLDLDLRAAARARAPGLRGREPQAPCRRADRALAGGRHGREPRRPRRKRASQRTRRS